MHAPVIQAYFPGGRPPARLVTRMYPSPHLPRTRRRSRKKPPSPADLRTRPRSRQRTLPEAAHLTRPRSSQRTLPEVAHLTRPRSRRRTLPEGASPRHDRQDAPSRRGAAALAKPASEPRCSGARPGTMSTPSRPRRLPRRLGEPHSAGAAADPAAQDGVVLRDRSLRRARARGPGGPGHRRAGLHAGHGHLLCTGPVPAGHPARPRAARPRADSRLATARRARVQPLRRRDRRGPGPLARGRGRPHGPPPRSARQALHILPARARERRRAALAGAPARARQQERAAARRQPSARGGRLHARERRQAARAISRPLVRGHRGSRGPPGGLRFLPGRLWRVRPQARSRQARLRRARGGARRRQRLCQARCEDAGIRHHRGAGQGGASEDRRVPGREAPV